tara:strand:- start:3778 stop:4200 length:423 start_codon:yes stop_codon:yes gene_type:complete
MNVSITAEKISITLNNPTPAFATGVLSTISVSEPAELEWSNTLCDGERVDYAAAEKAVAELGEGWRLPTRQELESLLDLSRHEPSIDTEKYPDTKSTYYWTSSKCAWNDAARWVVYFGYGLVDGHHMYSHACVRAVRASQ